jgi:hypothetical protein
MSTFNQSDEINFPNFSGLLLLTYFDASLSYYTTSLTLCGGQLAYTIGNSAGNTAAPNIQYDSNIDGYKWTQDYASPVSTTIVAIRTFSNA